MEKLQQTCAEIQLDLIRKILKINNCEKFSNEKVITPEWLSPPFDGEVTFGSKENEVGEKEKNLPNLPADFIVDDIEKLFKENMFSLYFHIYFVRNYGDEITILFRFNNSSTNNTDIQFDIRDALYELKGTTLSKLTNLNTATDYINNFKNYYDSINSEDILLTQYITFHVKNLIDNFYGFEPNTKLILGLKIDQNGNLRLNIILDIDERYCKNSKYAVGNRAYYNIGNMQP